MVGAGAVGARADVRGTVVAGSGATGWVAGLVAVTDWVTTTAVLAAGDVVAG